MAAEESLLQRWLFNLFMPAEERDTITFIFTGVRGEIIPRNATRFIAHESVTSIPAHLFNKHPNIVELICHAGVERIEEYALYYCHRLRRVIIPGVKIVEDYALYLCEAVTYVECPMLERIGESAFHNCKSLSDINLPSAKVVQNDAFYNCDALTGAKFGKSLESIRGGAFRNCRSLERITIPLKDGLFAAENIFQACVNLKSVDLVEMAELRETIAALLREEWRNDMKDKIDSINQSLPNAPAGQFFSYNYGEKARAIQEWIASVLWRMICYKALHRRLVNVASTSLMHAFPNDIVMNDVLPFLELPAHTFDGEEEFEEASGTSSDDANDESYDTSDGGDDDNDEDGDEDDISNNDKLHNASFGRGHHEEEGGDDKARKRRKTTDNTE